MHQVCLSKTNTALTDHASQDNHVINWPAATILDRESDKSTSWIKEAVHYSERGMVILELGWGQLHTEPHVRPISCHVTSLSWQEPEELNKVSS